MLVQNRVEADQTVLCDQRLIDGQRRTRARHVDGGNEAGLRVQLELARRVNLGGGLELRGEIALGVRGLDHAVQGSSDN